MFLPTGLAHRVASVIYRQDILCREELRNGVLVNERDYVTALTTGIRREFALGGQTMVHTQTLPGGAERRLGADAILVVKYEDKFKIAIFESKWPRAHNNNQYPWDYLSNGISHFTHQMERQANFIHLFAIWEMFFYEGPTGFDSPPYDNLGSSCLLFPDAMNHSIDNGLRLNLWNSNHLRTILRHRGKSIYDILYLFLTCRIGKTFSRNVSRKYNQNEQLLFPELDFNVPIPMEIANDYKKDDSAINNFMKSNGFEEYIFIDTNKLRDK